MSSVGLGLLLVLSQDVGSFLLGDRLALDHLQLFVLSVHVLERGDQNTQHLFIGKHWDKVGKTVALRSRVLQHKSDAVDCKDADFRESVVPEKINHQLERVVSQRSRAVVHELDGELQIGHHRAEFLVQLVLGCLVILCLELKDLQDDADLLDNNRHIELLHELSIPIWVSKYDDDAFQDRVDGLERHDIGDLLLISLDLIALTCLLSLDRLLGLLKSHNSMLEDLQSDRQDLAAQHIEIESIGHG